MAYVRGLPYGGHNGPPFYFEGKYYYPQTCFELKESFIKEYEQKHGKTLWPYMAYASKNGNNVRLTAPNCIGTEFPDREEFTFDKLAEMNRDFFSRGPKGLKYLDCFSIPFWQLSSVIKRIIKPYEVPEEEIKQREAAMEGYLPRRMQSKEYKKAHPLPILTYIIAYIIGFTIFFSVDFNKGGWLGGVVIYVICTWANKSRGIY